MRRKYQTSVTVIEKKLVKEEVEYARARGEY